METIKGTVHKIIYSSPDKAYKVLLINPHIIITGEFGPEIIPETVATFHGDYRNHPKYGSQFQCQSYEVFYNAEELSSVRLFIDAIAPNIGSERSMAITSHFKEDTIRILDEEPERLVEVDGIGKVSAESLMKSWNENRSRWNDERKIYSLRAFLLTLGLKEKRIRRILNHFGNQAITEDTIKEDPYILTEIDGFGFSTVDYIARRLNIPEDSPSRARAFVRYLLNDICPSMGHLYYTKEEICGIATQYCHKNTTKFLGKDSLGLSDITPILDELLKDKYIIIDEDCIYATEPYKFENESAILLSQIIREPTDLIFLNKDTIEDHITKFEKENDFILSQEQRDALYFFAEKKVFVITGLPGSGKTTVLKAIVELALNMKLSLTCMTPTGISAKKLSETVKYDAYTIHRRLGYHGNSWNYDDINQYDTDVVILDETSMLDMEVCYRMLLALKKRTHIIFVGDQYQLPSVGAGNVLKELINSERVPVVRLEKIFRQDEASDIIKVAHKVKSGIIDLNMFSQDPKADVFFYREKNLDAINKFIVSMAQKFKDERRIFQIITPRNTGPLGVDPLNETLQAVLNPPKEDLKEIRCKYFLLRRGDRVIVRKNDYENDIYNGDIGKITYIGPEYITLEIDDRSVSIGIEEIDEKIKLAYAITVHRSQGLEYPYVILIMINQAGKMLLQRNLLYTAITRAKEKVIIFGHGSAIERAINNASVERRNTKFGERITKCLQPRKKYSSEQLQEMLESSQHVTPDMEPSSPKIEESCLTGSISD